MIDVQELKAFDEQLHGVIEYPWTRCYLVMMQVSERNDMIAADYQFSKEKPGFLRKHWDSILPLTLLDPFRLGNLVDLVIQTAAIPGDIVECGSYKGGSGLLMGLLLKELGIKKKVHLFDSFEGLPEPDKDHDKGYKRGQFKSNYDKLQAKVAELELEDFIVFHKGWFNETVPTYMESYGDQPISIFHIDCDLYNSTMQCFPQLYPLVATKGAVVLDDFNDGGRGEKLAVVQTLMEQGKSETIIVGPASQSYFIKGKKAENGDILDGEIYYNVSELLINQSYISWLESTIEEDFSIKLRTLLSKEMEKGNILTDLNTIVSEVLDIDDLAITEETTAKDVEGWDSISYIEIVAAIEKHFSVKFKLLELEEFQNIGDIVSGIKSKLS